MEFDDNTRTIRLQKGKIISPVHSDFSVQFPAISGLSNAVPCLWFYDKSIALQFTCPLFKSDIPRLANKFLEPEFNDQFQGDSIQGAAFNFLSGGWNPVACILGDWDDFAWNTYRYKVFFLYSGKGALEISLIIQFRWRSLTRS